MLIVILLAVALLSLQLGWSYWLSGSTLGFFAFLIFLYPSLYRPRLIAVNNPFLMPVTLLLGCRILYASSTLRDIRYATFLFLYYIVANSVFIKHSFRSFSASCRILFAAIITTCSLGMLHVVSFIPGSFLYSSNRLIFYDTWLIQNKNFDSLKAGLLAISYKYFGILDRFSLLYGEPSYLAGVLLTCGSILIYGQYIYRSSPYNSRPNLPSYLPLFHFLSFIFCLLLLLTSGSFLGVVAALYLLSLAYYSTSHSVRIKNLKKMFILFGFGSLFVISLAFSQIITSPLVQLLLIRSYNIFAGSDLSASGRIYSLPLIFSNPFGIGSSSLMAAANQTGYYQIDSGFVYYLVSCGIFFILFAYFLFNGLPLSTPLKVFYALYLILIWSQNGEIFSIDKFLLAFLPLPLASLHESRMNST